MYEEKEKKRSMGFHEDRHFLGVDWTDTIPRWLDKRYQLLDDEMMLYV